MFGVLQRLLWFVIVASAVAYGTYLLVGSAIHADASGATIPVIARDKLRVGIHHISGMVMVPSTCEQLTVRAGQTDTYVYTLIFTTWEEPAVECHKEETPRPFAVTVFAPSFGVNFKATLNDMTLPIAVYPVIE